MVTEWSRRFLHFLPREPAISARSPLAEPASFPQLQTASDNIRVEHAQFGFRVARHEPFHVKHHGGSDGQNLTRGQSDSLSAHRFAAQWPLQLVRGGLPWMSGQVMQMYPARINEDEFIHRLGEVVNVQAGWRVSKLDKRGNLFLEESLDLVIKEEQPRLVPHE